MRVFLLYFTAFLLFVACALLIAAGLNMQTAVLPTGGTDAPTGFEGIANLQLMHFQLILLVLGVGAGIAGMGALVGGAICSTLDEAAAARPPSS